MPIYEYRCPNCKKRVSIFFRNLSSVDHAAARCPNCGSGGLLRLMSRVRVIRGSSKSMDSDGEDFGDEMLDGLDENDPRSMGRFMRKMAEESGEDLPPEFNEVVGRLEKGESPEDIEQSMPELGEMMGDAGDAGELGGEDE
ncbi:MAG TPA: zinc ribbon domain-containing protein [Anaerolineae bacterium]|nr:zinc ribbon domain-containing protein [Anaerolineae bacterium]